VKNVVIPAMASVRKFEVGVVVLLASTGVPELDDELICVGDLVELKKQRQSIS